MNDGNEVSGDANDCNQCMNEQEDITMVWKTEASKDDTIEEIKVVASSQMWENLSMKKQIEKLKNIAANMHKELNLLNSQSRRS